MGMVVSSAVAAGPAVLEDLETPFAVLQERKKKEREWLKLKHKSRRSKSQLKFEQRNRNILVTFKSYSMSTESKLQIIPHSRPCCQFVS